MKIHHFTRALAVATALLFLIQALAPQTAEARKKRFFPGKAYANGEIVTVTGTVTDAAGRPIADLDVVLEGSYRNFKFLKFRYGNDHPATITTRTNHKGEFTLDWKWHNYYNSFRLMAVLPMQKAGGKAENEVLSEENLSVRILQGSPVFAGLTIEDRAHLDSIRDFVASVNTADEKMVFGEMGRPDKVERLQFPDHEEVSWWYFDSGKTYRFRDGQVDQIVDFEPVERVASR